MVAALHPGYDPPTRRQLGGDILDNIYDDLKNSATSRLTNKKVTLCVDGWTNPNNEPILGFSVCSDGRSYLVKSIPTEAERHTGQYLAECVDPVIKELEDNFQCTVVGLVTDNAENMKKMRTIVQEKHQSVLQLGCAAHQLNLLAHDLHSTSVVNKVIVVAKFFRNHHGPHAWLNAMPGSTKPVLPSSTRWGSCLNTLEWFLKNWQNLRSIITREAQFFENASNQDIKKHVNDLGLYKLVEDFAKCLAPVNLALMKMQEDTCLLGDGLEHWKDLMESFEEMGTEAKEWQEKTSNRYDKCVSALWFVANALHPKFLGKRLTQDEWKTANDWVNNHCPNLMGSFCNFIGGDNEKVKKEFEKSGEKIKLDNFVRAQYLIGNLSKELSELTMKLMAVVPSSASVERTFSKMGAIHTDSRNRLTPEKVQKLTFCMQLLNS